MESLPPELQALIFRRLDFATLMKCGRVSRHWKGMIEQKAVLSEIFVHFPLPEVNINRSLLSTFGVRGDPVQRRFTLSLHALFKSLGIHRTKRITFTKQESLHETTFTHSELLVAWLWAHLFPGFVDVIRYENGVIEYRDWSDLLTMEDDIRTQGGIIPKPMFSIEMANIIIMFAPGPANVSAKIKCLTIPGKPEEAEKLDLFQGALRGLLQPPSVEACQVLQKDCQGFTFQQAKQNKLYEIAFQFLEKPAEEAEEAQMQRWVNLDVSTLEPLTHALLRDRLCELSQLA